MFCLSGELEILEADASRRLVQRLQTLQGPVLQALRATEPQIGIPDREWRHTDQTLGRQAPITRGCDQLIAEPRVARRRRLKDLNTNRLFGCADTMNEVNVSPLCLGQAFRSRKERRDADAARKPDLARATLVEVEPAIGPLDLHAHPGSKGVRQAPGPATQPLD